MKSLFLPSRYLHNDNEVLRPAQKSFGVQQWIIGRELCLYRLFFLGDMPGTERKSALTLRITQWSPFKEFGSYVVWQESSAQVWIWDESARSRVAAENGVGNACVIPETLLQPSPPPNTIRLLTCLRGLEGQIWKGGALAASRWWAEPPAQSEWLRFLAANDLAPTEIPPPQQLGWLARPWGRQTAAGQTGGLYHEKILVSLCFAILAFALSWELASVWKWQQGITQEEARAAALSEEVEPLLAARGHALEDKAGLKRLTSLTAYPSQLELLAAVAEKLSARKVQFVEWHYSSGTLSFTVEGKNLDPTNYVTSFQAQDFFYEVTAEKSRKTDHLDIKLKVNKR